MPDTQHSNLVSFDMDKLKPGLVFVVALAGSHMFMCAHHNGTLKSKAKASAWAQKRTSANASGDVLYEPIPRRNPGSSRRP
jgi:hypothetical protein